MYYLIGAVVLAGVVAFLSFLGSGQTVPLEGATLGKAGVYRLAVVAGLLLPIFLIVVPLVLFLFSPVE